MNQLLPEIFTFIIIIISGPKFHELKRNDWSDELRPKAKGIELQFPDLPGV